MGIESAVAGKALSNGPKLGIKKSLSPIRVGKRYCSSISSGAEELGYIVEVKFLNDLKKESGRDK
ncbi:MAG: hypothetical protein WCK61_06440 [Candidatus Omnitrophota bacterium]